MGDRLAKITVVADDLSNRESLVVQVAPMQRGHRRHVKIDSQAMLGRYDTTPIGALLGRQYFDDLIENTEPVGPARLPS